MIRAPYDDHLDVQITTEPKGYPTKYVVVKLVNEKGEVINSRAMSFNNFIGKFFNDSKTTEE